jgi:hypothetical protein
MIFPTIQQKLHDMYMVIHFLQKSFADDFKMHNDTILYQWMMKSV